MYRGQLRARNLALRGQGGDFDLITGSAKPSIPEPEPPKSLLPTGVPRF